MIVLDLLAAIFVLLGAFLCFAAAVALIRFPDVLTKLHAITKPQVLGMTCICLGVALGVRTWWALFVAVLAIGFQLLTAPVSASMVARSAYRSGLIPRRNLIADDLADDLADVNQPK
ncbi:monovalent cation/H(+) antiporter subunit G [uncultured Tessaracoccus sp.]|uniref:monovalent cation/H(+) antiporter subunit G n=1 Tax=uncultured Tessaracoccus sp. TaxID=905023 RepID=UPI00263132CA|nr:monovalent cation/H(+) antiporter subunit G [uncultured Tessaracoccus sp.]